MARSTARRTAAESITRFLTGRARPVTAEVISDKTGINLNTTRTTLGLLTGSGSVKVAGRETPSFGRPANLYLAA
jgi:predicted ArsR family transcriptional regulator